jgi:hypothetical protein
VDELMAIPDEQFEKYNELQKSNLVARFAVNWPFPFQTMALTNRVDAHEHSNTTRVR